MYINSGYLHNSLLDFKDKTHPPGGGKLRHLPSDPSAQASHLPSKRKN